MKLFHILAMLISFSAVFSYFNYRYLKLPTAIGLMLIALLASLALLVLGPLTQGIEDYVAVMLQAVDFDETLLHGMLSFLLFAGALHVNLAYRQEYLLARLVSVALPIGIMRRYRTFSPKVVAILTWGGLRGGISVALALSLPQGTVRDTLVMVTYIVVVFSILVQGLTIGPLVRRTQVMQ